MNSQLGFFPKFTALSMFIQQRLTLQVSKNRTHDLNTAVPREVWSYASKHVKPGQKLHRRLAKATQLRRAAYAYTGTNRKWYKYICKYVNLLTQWTL